MKCEGHYDNDRICGLCYDTQTELSMINAGLKQRNTKKTVNAM